jgi:hypothetical protein
MTMREAVERSRGHIEKCEPSFRGKGGKVVWGANEQKDSCSYLLLGPHPPRARGAIRQGTHEAGGQSYKRPRNTPAIAPH